MSVTRILEPSHGTAGVRTEADPLRGTVGARTRGVTAPALQERFLRGSGLFCVMGETSRASWRAGHVRCGLPAPGEMLLLRGPHPLLEMPPFGRSGKTRPAARAAHAHHGSRLPSQTALGPPCAVLSDRQASETEPRVPFQGSCRHRSRLFSRSSANPASLAPASDLATRLVWRATGARFDESPQGRSSKPFGLNP